MLVWKQTTVVHEINRKQMEKKIVERNLFLNFKEQMLALKFRILREWREKEQLVLSPRKGRGKYHQIDGFFSSVHLPSYQFQSSLQGMISIKILEKQDFYLCNYHARKVGYQASIL